MKKRKFINFSDKELNILADAIERYGCPDLMKQINDEIKTREYNKKRVEEWAKQKPTFYCC
jgi:hypothetical protein